jgi:hypothetical protein
MLTNLLIVVAAGLLAPLALGFFPRVRLPAIVLETLLGIVIGPSGLGWAKPDAAPPRASRNRRPSRAADSGNARADRRRSRALFR